MRSASRLRTTLCILAMVLLAAACSSSGSDDAAAPDSSSSTTPTTEPEALAFDDPIASRELRVSVPRLQFVDPAFVDEVDSVQVLVTDLLTDGLTRWNPRSGFADQALAESWTVSDDLLTWTFILGDNTFGTGEPITADDVAASLARVAARGVESLSGPNLGAVEGYDAIASGETDEFSGVQVVDDSTLVIRLTEPYMALPELLAGVAFGVYPADTNGGDGFVPATSSQRFVADEMTADGLRLVARNADDRFSAVALVVDETPASVEAGEVDVAIGLDPAEGFVGYRTSVSQRSADVFFAMNHKVAPFDDVEMRRAIMQAVNRVSLRNEFFPRAGVMESFVPQDVAGGSADACGRFCEYDIASAYDTVEQSEVGGVPFTVDFFASEDDGDDFEQRLAEAIVSDLRAAGLDATAVRHDAADYGRLIADGELGLFRFGSVTTALTADADLAAMFATDGHDNVTGTSIDEFDHRIERARQTERDSARAKLYAEAEAMLFDSAVVLPLVEFRHTLVMGDGVLGAMLAPDGSLDLSSIQFSSAG